MTARLFEARGRSLPLGERTLLMGILNVTPDSFSDGGLFADAETACRHAEAMCAEGADILDLGGESTRPGAVPLDAEEEANRILPVLKALRRRIAIPLSVDTYKAEVARQAFEAGAEIVNDVWGFQHDPDMARTAADYEAGAILMHNRREVSETVDILAEVRDFLSRSIELALAAGVKESRIVIDPGVGFGKTPAQSMEVISRLQELGALGFPILVGASRKRFIGGLTGIDDPRQRLHGTIGAHLAAAEGGADIVRVHDIKPHREAFDVFDALRRSRS